MAQSTIDVVPEKQNKQEKEFNKIIRSIFRLTPTQMKVFSQVREFSHTGTCILNLVQLLDSERSIIQKYLKVLMDKELVSRKSVTLSEFQDRCRQNDREDIAPSTTKGYLYIYTPIPDELLISRIKAITDKWIQKVKQYCNI